MTVALIILFALVIAFSAVAIGAFGWAAKTHQFSEIEKGSESIFDEDEPIGRATDGFPKKLPPANRSQKTS
ncbi:MAG: cbb3-type cytochrome oxidase assembly protein CcoS [Verrucomicrobiia bacterium]